jgi:hypothetical protein
LDNNRKNERKWKTSETPFKEQTYESWA